MDMVFQRPLRAAAASATCNTSGRLRVRRLTACAASPRCDSGLEVQMFQASRLKAANSRSLIATPFITLPAAEGNQKIKAYRVCLRTTSCLLLCAGRPDRSWLLLAAGATVGTDGGGVADLGILERQSCGAWRRGQAKTRRQDRAYYVAPAPQGGQKAMTRALAGR